MNKLPNPLLSTEVGRASRRREVENALLTQAICGRPVSASTQALLSRYESGELSREAAFADLYRMVS